MSKLEDARKIINQADEEMAKLFLKRMRAVECVFEYKKTNGLPIFDEEREREVIIKNSAYIKDEVIKSYYIDFLKNMMDVSKKYQYRLQEGAKIAYSGIEGAFAHIAAGKIFDKANLVSYQSFDMAYNAVEKGECDVVVLPIENSYAGEVGAVVDLIFNGSLYINGMYDLVVHQNLLGVKGAKRNEIKTVLSHPQAISQCMEYIKENGLEALEAGNTAVAAKTIVEENDTTKAAIASLETAKLYNLEVLERNINKSSLNSTRFAVLSKTRLKEYDNNNSVLMFTVSNEAGALAKAVNIIGKHNFNMTALRSRPLKEKPWEYYFYTEIDGKIETNEGRAMLEELKSVCDMLKIAGTFLKQKSL